MIGPYESEDEMLEAILHWQKRALAAEKEVEETLDDLEVYIKLAAYYKQQRLDKDEEIKEIMKHASFITGGE